MEFLPFTSTQAIAEQLAAHITAAGHDAPALVFLSGGSNVPLLAAMTRAVDAAAPVIYTLADERYGNPGHENSNWQQLIAANAVIPDGSYQVLRGGAMQQDCQAFNNWLSTTAHSRYKIGIFGMGLDGHVAGLLPNSPALQSEQLADCYTGPDFERITITPALIKRLDAAYLVFQGQEKLALAKRIMAGEIMAPARSLLAVPNVVSYYVD